jgi:hypothetical protein
VAEMSPDQIEQNFVDLDFTQGIRKKIVNAITDKAISDKDPEMLDKTFKALDGMDKVSLGRLKLNEKAKENQTNQDEAAALAQYLMSLSARRQKEEPTDTGRNDVLDRKLPEGLRPAYDPSIRESTAIFENTAEFTERVEGKTR